MKKFPILRLSILRALILALLTLTLELSLHNYCYAIANLRQPQMEQQPFVCKTIEAGLGAPIIDNDFNIGTPVYNVNNATYNPISSADTNTVPNNTNTSSIANANANLNTKANTNANIIGYSQNCAVKPQTEYFYKSTLDGKFYKLESTTKYPENLAKTKTGCQYIVQVSRGTSNRFLYAMLILHDPIKISQINGKNPNNIKKNNSSLNDDTTDTDETAQEDNKDDDEAQGANEDQGEVKGKSKNASINTNLNANEQHRSNNMGDFTCQPNSAWNHKLIYYFGGGVGTGFQQASTHSLAYIKDFSKLLAEIDFLNEGYAVIFSTGTTTSTHYNLQLGLQTANELKNLFSKTYHKPLLTIGFGGSGGAIQGYVYAEHDKNLLDGIIVTHSYPDMITQMLHVGDCELLEHYFDAKAKTEWTWERRQLIEGMHSSSSMIPKRNYNNPYVQKFAQENGGLGCSSCVNGWRGTIPMMLNPTFNTIKGAENIRQKSKGFTHFEDVSLDWKNGVYPRDGFNYTPHIYDNEGVQYGLKALLAAQISKEEFFDLNQNVGGWKPTELLEPEQGFPFGSKDPKEQFNAWSAQNAFQATNTTNNVALRSTIPIELAELVKKSGLYFSGNTSIPIIDWRPHLDHQGDMHFAYGSFMARSRILRSHNNHDNHVIWMSAIAEENPMQDSTQTTQNSTQKPHHQQELSKALRTLDLWLSNYKNKKLGETLLANKPDTAIDACFDEEGKPIYQGNDAWDGIIDKKAKGTCSIDPKFKVYSTSRIEALQAKTQDTFKCKLIPIREFINNGGYANIEMNVQDMLTLEHIFPTGVCEVEHLM